MSRRWLLVGLIFAGILISYIDRGNLGIAAPSITKDFNLSNFQMGTLLSAFFWTYACFQIPAGAIVDRVGIRRVYAFAFVVWSLASAAIGLSRGLTDILIFRMLLGLAESIGPIASISFIRKNFSGAEIGLPTAIYIAGQNLGPAAGTLIGTILIANLGWRAMFIITGMVALLWLPGWLWFAPRDDARTVATPDTPPPPPIPWTEVIKQRAFIGLTLCVFLSGYFWYFVLTWVPTYLTVARGYSITEMGRILSGPLFAMAVVNILSGFVADRLVRRGGSVFRVRLWFCAAGHMTSGLLLLLLVLHSRAAVLPVLLISVCATGMGNSNYWALAQQTAPSYLVGRAIGYLNTIAQIAGATAPLITGWVLGPTKDFTLALAIAGVCAPLAALVLIVTGVKGLETMRQTLDRTAANIPQPAA
ncbi:MAG TPA: MFS transporter [Bryobacteraceae bacterium]|jgi:MFS family permease